MLTLQNPRRLDLEAFSLKALADTGSVYLIIPQHVQFQLGLEAISEKEVTLADDSKRMVPYVGPLEVRFKNRVAFTGAIVMGEQVLLGRDSNGRYGSHRNTSFTNRRYKSTEPNYAAALAK